MTASWITVGFVPAATEPPFAHKADPHSDSTLTEQIAGWLIDHKYHDGSAVPIDSRVVAGVWRDGKVLPVHTTLTRFVGVYPKGETPPPRDVAASRDRG